MLNYITNLINSQKIYKTLLLLFLFSLFFPIRHVFLTNSAYLSGQYSDFTSFSLYLSDILLFILFVLTIWQNSRIDKSFFKLTTYNLLLTTFTFWLILGLIWHFKTIYGLNIYYFIKCLELLIVAYGTAAVTTANFKYQISNIKIWISHLFVIFCSIQSLIALMQFWTQSSLGLYRLGESHLSQSIVGTAKILANNHVFIRGYGTFPHPNVLAAFLVVSILIAITLYLYSTWKQQIWCGIAIFLNILGLTVTFSRSAYLALAIGLAIFLGFALRIKDKGLRINPVIVIVIVSSAFSFLLLRPYLISRAIVNDNTLSERMLFNQIGLNMIKANPMFGVGTGESMLHMEQYSNQRLEPWQKQPIHNYFLLSAAELGIPGALILICILLSHLKAISYKLKASQDSQLTTYNLLLTTILCVFLVLMLFDHYFYTLQQTQLLLWIILGTISAIKKEDSAS